MNLFGQNIKNQAALLFNELAALDEKSRIDTINALRRMLHVYSPFKEEPVDCVIWVETFEVEANDYKLRSLLPIEVDSICLLPQNNRQQIPQH